MCLRWRHLVLLSTSRLQVHLLFTPRKPSSDPALTCLLHLPILVDYSVGFWTKKDEDLAHAAIFHHSRVRGIALAGPCASRLLRELCHPFPKLESFEFCFPFRFSTPYHMHKLIISATFLLPAPCLRRLTLRKFVPTCLSPLLSSATGLVELALTIRVRRSVLPDACVLPDTSLIANLQRLSCLRCLELKLANQDIAITPDSPPSPAGDVVRLIKLTDFIFMGCAPYVDMLVARLVAPSLQRLDAEFWSGCRDFPITHLCKFICDTECQFSVVRLDLFR